MKTQTIVTRKYKFDGYPMITLVSKGQGGIKLRYATPSLPNKRRKEMRDAIDTWAEEELELLKKGEGTENLI